MKIDYDYFLREFHAFRAILCSTEYTTQDKLDAFGGLLTVYFNVTKEEPEQEERMKMAMGMLSTEVPMRLSLEAGLKLQQVLGE